MSPLKVIEVLVAGEDHRADLRADADTASAVLLESRLTDASEAPLENVAPQLASHLAADGEGSDGRGTFRLNNALWSTSGGGDARPFVSTEPFVAAAERLYGAAHRSLDFKAPGASRALNAWAQDTTNGLIPSVIDDQLLSTLDWVILNTALFEGAWGTAMRRLPAADDYRFAGLDGTMQAGATLRTVDYVAHVVDLDDGSLVFQLPFAGRKYAFVVRVPAADQPGMTSWLLDTAVPEMAEVTARVFAGDDSPFQLSIRLPVFAFGDSVTLRDGSAITQALGLAPLFDRRADLSRLSATPSRVDLIKQDTRIELDENGVRAAAATLIGGVRATSIGASYPARTIVVDRPFAFAIVERTTQSLLFNGVLVAVPPAE